VGVQFFLKAKAAGSRILKCLWSETGWQNLCTKC